MSNEQEVHVYVIGSDGTEVYAAHSREQMEEWYRKTGSDYAEEDLRDHFEEIADIDTPMIFKNEESGNLETTTYRALALDSDLPTQLLTSYN